MFGERLDRGIIMSAVFAGGFCLSEAKNVALRVTNDYRELRDNDIIKESTCQYIPRQDPETVLSDCSNPG